jgi:hypothetical protein
MPEQMSLTVSYEREDGDRGEQTIAGRYIGGRHEVDWGEVREFRVGMYLPVDGPSVVCAVLGDKVKLCHPSVDRHDPRAVIVSVSELREGLAAAAEDARTSEVAS